MKTYPFVSEPNKQDTWRRMGEGKGPKCCVCGAKALAKVFVEVDIYRGDDIGPFKVCGTKHDAETLLATQTATEKP